MPLQLFDPDERRDVVDADLPGVVDGDRETVYVIRPIGVDDHRAIVKRNTKQVIDRASHQKVPMTDYGAVNDDVLDFILVEWRGVLFRGEPVPCERVHKVKLDPVRRQALADVAGMNQIARAPEVRAESFRESA